MGNQNLTDNIQSRATIIFIAGIVEGSRHENPDYSVDDVLELLSTLSKQYKKKIRKQILRRT